jgi:peptidoglycan/LPS O-acetylase OafA/YrhL
LPQASRLQELDALRGLAALYVLMHHNMIAAGLLTGRLQRWLEMSPLRGLMWGRPAVLFFFVLSGFVLTRALRAPGTGLSARGYAGWVLQRSVRLGLPTLAALAISLLLYQCAYHGTWPGESGWLVDRLWHYPPTPGEIARHALLLVPDHGFALDNVLWSLVHEWRLSMLFPFVAAAAIFQGKRGAALLVLIGIAVTGMVGGPFGESYDVGRTPLRDVRTTLYFTLPFLLGVALEMAEVADLRADRWQVAAGLLAVLGLGRIGSDLAILMASVLLIWLAQQPGPLQRVLRHPVLVWLGMVSFSLYLIHEPVLGVLHHTLHGLLSPAAICTISLAAAVPAAWLFYLGVERPVHRLARRIGHAQRSRRTTPARRWWAAGM